MIDYLRKLIGLLLSLCCSVYAVEVTPEEDLTITTLPNGVQLWLRLHEAPRGEIACRIVARNPSVDVPQIFSLDCPADIFEDELPYFVEYCRESIRHQTACDIGIIVVGDFDLQGLQTFLTTAMEIFAQRQMTGVLSPVTIIRHEALEGIYCALHYATPRFLLRNDQDIKKLWVFDLLQKMCYDRFHKALSYVNAEWMFSPEPKYFLPYLQTSAKGRQKSGKDPSEMLVTSLTAMQELKKDGFTKAELSNAKAKLQTLLLSFYQPHPDENMLADYYTSHFSFGTAVPSYETFMTSSMSLIEDISMQDMAEALETYFLDNSRTVEYKLAKEFPQPNETIEAKAKKDLSNYQSDGFVFDLDDEALETDLYTTLLISEAEVQMVYELIDIMATNNLAKLLVRKSEMEKRGKRINHIHPMRFLGTIFSNLHLKKCMADVMDSFFKWDGFMSGLAPRLEEEHQKDNLLPYIAGFCQAVKANPDQVRFYIQKKKWEELVTYLVKLAP